MNKLPGQARPNPLDALRGLVHALDLPLADVSINTVAKLLEDAGEVCAAPMTPVRGVKAKRVQCDEIWSFLRQAKERRRTKAAPEGAGDTWTWTAIDADSKMILSYFVGDRDGECATWFIQDLAERLANRVQLTSDGHKAYLEAVEGAFGADVDYAMLMKLYGARRKRRAATARLNASALARTGSRAIPIWRTFHTSYVERANLTMRMHNRRFTRLTNAFSKKFENHAHMVAIYAVWYNFLRIHKTLRVTPAMAAASPKRSWTGRKLWRRWTRTRRPRTRPLKKNAADHRNRGRI